MLDDDPEVRRLFSLIGQVVVFHRHLHQALHDGCTAIFASQGFEALDPTRGRQLPCVSFTL